jgi:hypothetical protein
MTWKSPALLRSPHQSDAPQCGQIHCSANRPKPGPTLTRQKDIKGVGGSVRSFSISSGVTGVGFFGRASSRWTTLSFVRHPRE